MINQIILINSGGFAHQEFSLNGMMHFSGPNGFGKTSLLKASIFAYSGDIKEFGATGMTHFFPTPKSLLIYEMGTGKQAFTVCVSKQGITPEILLVKGMYEREIFMAANHRPHSQEVIIKNIKKRKLDYVAQVKTGEDYQKIIYGQENGKNKSLYRKFSLLQSEKAHLIIQSQRDLLEQNSINLSHIKHRITTLSLHDNQQISVLELKEKLKNFIHHWRSIEAFKKNRSLIPEISLMRGKIEKYEAEITDLLGELIGLSQDQEAYRKTLKKEIKTLDKHRDKIIAQLNGTDANTTKALEALLYQKAGLTYQLDLLQKKTNDYKGLNISALKVSAASLSIWEKKRQMILATLEGGKIQSKSKAKKKPSLPSGPYIGLQEKLKQRELENQYLTDRGEILSTFWGELAELEDLSQKRIQDLALQKKDLSKEIDTLKTSAFHIRRESLTDFPGEQNADRLVRLEEEFYQLSIEKERGQNRLNYLHKQKEMEVAGLTRDEAIATEEQKRKLAQLNQQIEEIQTSIEDMRGSFQEWLEGNYPDWEQSIGKICRPEVLRNPYLGPDIERLNELFYGIKLDLDEVELAITSSNDLKIQLEELQKELEQAIQEGLAINQQFDKKKLNLDKRFRQKIRQEENGLKKLNYEIDQVKIRIRQHKQAGKRQLNAFIQEAEHKAISIDYQVLEKEQICEDAQKNLEAAQKDWEKSKNRIKKKLAEKLQVMEGKYQKDKNELTQQFQAFKKNDFLNQPIDSLSVEELNLALFETEELIQEAKVNREILRESSQHSPSIQTKYETDLALIKVQINNHKSEYSLGNKVQTQTLGEIETKINATQEELVSVEKELTRIQLLKKEPTFEKYFLALVPKAKAEKTQVDGNILIARIRARNQKRLQEKLGLAKLINRFVSILGEGNLMGLSMANYEGRDYLKLALKIEEFEQKDQVDAWTNTLAEQYAGLVDEISLASRQLSNIENNLEETVAEFDDILHEFPYDSTFKRVHFSYTKSNHSLATSLKEIQAFAAENANQLGASTLFNQTENQSENKHAVNLLIHLFKQLNEMPGEYMNPGILFDLRAMMIDSDGEESNLTSSLSGLSSGFERMYQILIHTSIIALVCQKAENTMDSAVHCCLDNLQELELARVDQLADFMHTLSLSMISASVNPVYLENIKQGYHLREKSESKISAYQILSKAG